MIWHGNRTWSTSAQVMACCLTAPIHHMNQCWLNIREVLWHLSESNFTGNIGDTFLICVVNSSTYGNHIFPLRGHWCLLDMLRVCVTSYINLGSWWQIKGNLQAKVSATVRLFGGDSSHTPFFYWQSFQGNTLYPLAIIHMEYINVLDFEDKSERNLCFSFGNLGIIFSGASAQLFPAQGEMVIRLGQRSPTGQWRQRLIDADWNQGVHYWWFEMYLGLGQ